MNHDVKIKGASVTLDPLRLEHVTKTYVGWLNDPEVVGYTEIGEIPHDLVSARQYVCDALAASNAMMWRILAEDGKHVGNIRLSSIDKRHRRAAIALIIGERQYRGRGLGTDAIRALTRHALGEMGLQKISAGIYAPNKASLLAFERAGFRVDAVLHGHANYDGSYVDVIQLARFSDSARASQATAANVSFLPYGRQLIEHDDVAAVSAVLRSDWLTTGPAVKSFESALSKRVDAKHAVACSSGTAALHLAAMALDLGPDDRVVVPAVTFLATANAVRLAGAEVVFADVDPETGLMDAARFEQAMQRDNGKQPTAVFPVHYAGQCADPKALAESAARHGCRVVEDAAHAIGSVYQANGAAYAVGSARHALMTAFSFHPVKNIAMGEGGAVTTNDDGLAERLRRLRNHGMTRDADAFENRDMAFTAEGDVNPWYYEMHEPGLNYRASDIHCALAESQLGKLDRFIDRRRTLTARYDRLLAPLAPVVRPLGRVPGCKPAWHIYPALIDFAAAGRDRRSVMGMLREAGIGSQVHYIPVHQQPYYRDRSVTSRLPGAESFYERVLSLPLFASMQDADADRVVEALRRAVGG